LLLAVCAEGSATADSTLAKGAPKTAADAAAIYAGVPIMFEANQGQTDARVKYLARGPGYTLFLTRQEAVLKFAPVAAAAATKQPSILRLKFLHANPEAQVFGRDELRGKTNYLLGNDPQQWHRNVPNYAAAEYQALYSGVDAVFHDSQARDQRRRLEFDFEVAPGADPGRVALQVDGARRLRLSRAGDVLVGLDGQQEVVLGRPHVYQQIAGQRREVAGEYMLRAHHRLAFALGPYDHSQRLIIDPTLGYSTYVTGGQVTGIALNAAAVDSGSHTYIYIVGTAGTLEGLAVFPTNALQTTCQACEFVSSAFVAKYDTSQSGAASLIYSTYLGPAGSGVMPDELGIATGSAIAVDAAGDAFVTGTLLGDTGSTYFPTTSNAYLTSMPASQAGFLSELDPTGETLKSSTYLPGGFVDAIALDSADNAYITGVTTTAGLFTAGVVQQTLQGGCCNKTPFVAKLNLANSGLGQLVYYTYLGGSSNVSGISDTAMAIAVDAAGEAYVVGGTYVGACNYVSCTGSPSPPSFPVPANAGFQSKPGGLNESGYLAKLNVGATQLLYFSYVGGGVAVNGTGFQNGTQVNAVTLDAGGNAYVTGVTGQIALPTTNSSAGPVVGPQSTACQTTGSGTTCPGGFVAEISAGTSGSKSLVFLTYLGGVSSGNAGTTVPTGIAVDSTADIYVAGTTSTSDMPLPGKSALFPDGVQPSSSLPCIGALPECTSPFLVELEPGAVSILLSGYLAGTGSGKSEQDTVAGMAFDGAGNVYLAGSEVTNDFPVTTNAYHATPPSGATNGYLAMIGGLPTSEGVTSIANYSYNGQPPTAGILGSVFTVSAPATTSVAVPIILTNTGATAFTVSGISLVGSASPPWTFTSLTCNGTPVPLPISSAVSVGPLQSCTILLQFAPTLVQTGQTEGLEILDNASSSNASGTSSEQVMYLAGTGTAAPAASFASYSTNGQPIVQANFLVPAVMLAADVGGTAATQLVLTNTGGEPFTISGVSLPASSPPSSWSVKSVACPSSVTGPPSAASPVTLAPGQVCTISLQFAPTALGTFDAALTVLDTASGSNLSAPSGGGQEFILQGTGGQPNAQYAVSSGPISTASPEVNFGNVPEDTAVTQTVTVMNTGNGPLTITAAPIAVSPKALSTASYWALTEVCGAPNEASSFPVTVAPGASCVFTFQFDPAVTGNLVAVVSFADNAAQSNLASTLTGTYTQTVKLYGVGVLPLSGQVSSMTFTPEQLYFTNTSGTQAQTVMVTNTGTQSLNISEVEPFISQGAAFSLLQQGCTSSSGTFLPFPVSLPSDASCTFAFQYNEATEESITGGEAPHAVYAAFVDNAYLTNIGSGFGNTGAVQSLALLAPGATAIPDCGSTAGVAAGGGAMEGSLGRGWSQTITVSTTTSELLFGYHWVVLEGLTHSTFNEVAGTTATDQSNAIYSCGDLPGSPFVSIATYGVTQYGGEVGVASANVTLQFPSGAQPIYQSLKAASAAGAP
jgi:hypothetical protein